MGGDKMRMVTGCSGIEGIGIAGEWAGMELVGQIEIDGFCSKILEKYWQHVKRMKNLFDVRGDEFGAVDIFAAGIPCQPFSCAGKRKGNEDNRYLWPETIRIIRVMQPTWVIIENVDGIGTMEQSDYEIDLAGETTICTEADMVLETIRRDFKDSGYETLMLEIPACAVNACHGRARYFIVGYSDSISISKVREIQRKQEAYTSGNGQIMGNSERSGCTRHNRRRAMQESEDGYSDSEGGIMADSQGELFNGEMQPWSGRYGYTDSSKDMANTSCAGCKKFDIARESEGQGHHTRCSDAGRGIRPTQSGICRSIDELANRIHRFRQPAYMGQPQYRWEPPRTASGVKNRTNRLKALGNVVDPLQVYPILQIIYWIEAGQIEAVQHEL
jgi:DNA (cytosine-5)-methyltransferase 1